MPGGGNGNIVDELQLKFSADTGRVSTKLENLAKALTNVKNATAGLDSAVSGLNSFTGALERLSNLDASKLSKQVSVLNRLGKIDFKNLSTPIDIKVNDEQITSATQKISNFNGVLSNIANKSEKYTGVTQLASAMNTDMSGFDAEKFNDISNGVGNFAAIPDVSDKVTRLVSALAKLGNAGDKVASVSNALPNLSGAIQRVAVGLASSGGVPGEVTAFVSALGQLANAGTKTQTTASQLSLLCAAIRDVFSSMQYAPQISENALRMTEALAQLASAGSKTGSAAKGISEAFNKVGSVRLEGIKGAVKDLGNILEQVASRAKSAALKIFNALMKIGRARPSLASTASTIRNMIAAMIGFRGITGFATLLKQTISLGANLTEIDHIVESVFGDMTSAVDSWAKNAITEFGIAEHSAKQYAGVLSSMFQASQIGYKDAGKMAMDLVGLAGDLSAFYNIDTETAYNKIRSGMAGMVRPLRKQYCAYVQKCA